MIQNERQYRITQTKLREFSQLLADLDPPLGSLPCLGNPDGMTPQDPNLHPRQVIGWTNSYNLTIRQLKQELAEYEQLKSGNISTFVLGSLDDLPTTLIKARIATGMTQKELADKIGVREQQIQRYEASHYNSASFDRLRSIANTLNIEITQAVMQLHFN
ncbi:helix-turn-helix domain-containing protein [Chamaesiphon sp.]|uniref:helix-turn-helix domain-containing protein n=1 Tax=Chamaesiphon sp. TaxID=2814140 RepID=UPI0035933279